MTDFRNIVPTEDPLTLVRTMREHDRLLLCVNADGARIFTRTYYGGDGTPASEWHGLDVVLMLASGPGVVDADQLREDLADGGWLADRIARIIAGHGSKWDGNNYVGTSSGDKREAIDDIDRRVESEAPYLRSDWSVWTASEFLVGVGAESDALRDMDLTTAATDAEIVAAAASLLDIASSQQVVLTGDAEQAIRDLIASVKEAEEEAA